MTQLPDIANLDQIDYSKKIKYDGYEIESEYIRMRDGIELAITYCLPTPLTSQDKIPTILFLTRYWRTYQLRFPFNLLATEVAALTPMPEVFTSRGYAIIFVDCRGTGASYGQRPYPFFDEEIEDGNDIIKWVLEQSWSNGNVGTYGISYVGTMAELIARNKHPALKAIIPTHCFYDSMHELYSIPS